MEVSQTTQFTDFGGFVGELRQAGMIDDRYPVKGCYVWLPDGFALKESVFQMCEHELTPLGYRRYEFPRLVAGESIRRVTAGVANFEHGVFWLRRDSGAELDLFLSPTGETSVYSMFRTWIRDETQLPIRLYQIGHTFRPHKRPSVLLSGDEAMSLLEAHSAFATTDDASWEFDHVILAFERIHDRLGIPCLVLSRPQEGNKPVYRTMVSLETYLPAKRTSFNVGVVYNQGDIYSKPMQVTFTDRDGIRRPTQQVTFGISERGIAAMLDLHRDGFGLRMMPEFAPVQILVLPVFDGTARDDEVVAACRSLVIDLAGWRVELDASRRPAGKRMASWRQRGVPLRIGISSDNTRDGRVRVYLRTAEEPKVMMREEFLRGVADLLAEVTAHLAADAAAVLDAHIATAMELAEVGEITSAAHIARLFCCETVPCRARVSDVGTGEPLGRDLRRPDLGRCIACGTQGAPTTYFAKRSASP